MLANMVNTLDYATKQSGVTFEPKKSGGLRQSADVRDQNESLHKEEELTRTAELAKAGDRDAFGHLYEELAPRIYRYFYRHLAGEISTAEDLTEDVFVNVLRRLQGYTDRGLPFSSWVFRIAHNRLVDYFRAQQIRAHTALECFDETANPQPERQLERTLSRDTLGAALETLHADQRRVIMLRFVQDLNRAETAQALSTTEERVKSLQKRGLSALRRALSTSAA